MSGSASSLVSQRYANALLELAEGAKKLEKVEKDLKDLGLMLQNSLELGTVINSPLIPQDDMIAALNAIADKAKFQDITKNFLFVLVQNGRIGAVEKIITAFDEQLAKKRGQTSVEVTVAQDLSSAQKKELEAALSKAMGQTVAVDMKVEPGILGGMVITVGSQMIDASVARKLERLKSALGVANENTLSTLSEVV